MAFPNPMYNSVFAINKPTGMTSHDVVAIVRRKTGVKRVGHGGTLDPLAEGVLVIAVGRENTKLLSKYVKGDKEYIATLKLGYISETDDSEGPIRKYKSNRNNSSTFGVPTTEDIRHCIKKFIGHISQTPPIYSAVKVNGKEAYKYARKGKALAKKLEPREVFIKKIEIIKYDYPLLELKVECGSGVYIRSLARDLGESLNAGAYLEKLVRTRVGEFTLAKALKIEELKID